MRAPVTASLLSVWLCGCAGAAPGPVTAVSASALDGTRWGWLDVQCSDGALPLATHGFERELRIEVRGGALRLTEDSALAEAGCRRSELLRAEPEAGRWGLVLQASLTTPADAPCGPRTPALQPAALGLSGDVLEVLQFGSAWCRGYDARFTYRRLAPEALAEDQLLARYYLLFNARDAASLTELFAERASLVEPFTRTDDGLLARHEGRDAIRTWFERAFAAAPRLAIRLTEMRSDEPGQHVVSWEYMDDQLAEPLRGRNLFVIAAGEIFETQVQLLEAPRPRATAPAAAAAAVAPEVAP
jgi:ketosteroid isomerase-like protein